MTAEEMLGKLVELNMHRTATFNRDHILALCETALATQAYGKTECDEHDGEWCPEIEEAWGRVSTALARLVELGLLEK